MRKNKSTKLKIQPRVPSTYARPHANLRVFVDIDVPEGTQNVVLSDNRFVDFVGFNAVSSIESINFDNNPILSFRGFPKMPNLRSLSMLGTPISGLPTFRAQAIACCPQLRVINGSEVTSKEKSNAAAFGDPDVAYELISRGWLPKKPIALQPLRERDPNLESDRKKKKKNVPAPNSERIERIVAMQDSDPISVRMVRILRAQGMDVAQIRSSLRKHFAPTKERQTLSKTTKRKQDSGIEAQIQRQQEIINVMAAQLQALRTGNRTFNEYNEMLSVAGRPLIENAEFLSKLENGESLEQNKERKGFRPDYAVLRAAVLEFLEADESTPDKELIGFLNEIAEEEEKRLGEEHESSSSSSSSSTIEIESEKETEEEDLDEDKEVLHTGFYSDTSEETAPKPATEKQAEEKREEDLIPKELEEEEEELLELQKQDSMHSEKSSTDDSEQEIKALVEEEDINENAAHEEAHKDSSSSSNTHNGEVETKQENLEPSHHEEEELHKDSNSSSNSDNEGVEAKQDNLESPHHEEVAQKDSNTDNEEPESKQDDLEPAPHEEEEPHKESSSSSNTDHEEPEAKQDNLEPSHDEEEELEKDSTFANEEPEDNQNTLEPSHHEEEEKSDGAEIAATEDAAPPQPNEPKTTSDEESTSQSVNNLSDENISTDQEGLSSQD